MQMPHACCPCTAVAPSMTALKYSGCRLHMIHFLESMQLHTACARLVSHTCRKHAVTAWHLKALQVAHLQVSSLRKFPALMSKDTGAL